MASESALGNRATTVFDIAGQVSAIQDARGNRWSFTYDQSGRRTQQIDPLGRITTSGFDGAGQQTLRVDARGNPTTFSFDTVGRLTRRLYPDDSRATFTFDAVGNRTRMDDSTGIYTYMFDALNRYSSIQELGLAPTSYTHDALGQRASMIDPDGGRVTYTWDAAGRETLLVNAEGDRTTFSYDVAGRRMVKQLANGTRASYTYDAADQLSHLFNLKSDDSLISSFAYEVDPAGNRTSVLEGSGDRVTWTYDSTNQLTSEYRSGANAYFHTFVYDQVGNRLVKIEDGARTTYAYDSADQLQTSDDATGQTVYTFDANGNQRIVAEPTGQRTTWTWNYENQPPLVGLPTGARVTMAYNADFRRTKKSDTEFTRFVWDHATDAYLMEKTETGVTTAVYTNEPVLYGSLMSQRRGGATSYYHFDGQGATRELADAAQTVTDEYSYTAYGERLPYVGATHNSFQYVGYRGYHYDISVLSYYARARNYYGGSARWLQQDPLNTFNTAPAIYHNVYVYVLNNPANFVDPSGLQEQAMYDDCPKERIPPIPPQCLNSTAKVTEVAVCARPIRGKPIGCHIYLKVFCGQTLNDVFSYGGVEGPVCVQCKDKCMSQLRMYFGPFREGEDPPNPDFPRPPDEPVSHICETYEVNRPPKEVMDCLREVARRIRACCIPYEWQAFGDPEKGCNSNCAASWMASLCFTPLKGGGTIELPKDRPKGCLGWDKKMPDCVKNAMDANM